MQFFETIFKMFGRAVFEAIEVKRRSMLNFEAATTFIDQNLLQNLSLNKQKFGTTMYFPENLENTPLQRKGSKLHFCQLRVPIMVQIIIA